MSALESILGMLPDRVSSCKQDQIFTPPHISKEMVNALPEDVWNKRTTFFDPICKSGIFLYEIYQKLMESADLIKGFPDKQARKEHIFKNQLYGIAVDQMCQLMSIRTVYGYLAPDNHIILLSDYQTVMRNTDKRFLLETLQKEFGTMKFDVVIGNPPYNRGMDLDFVDLGYKLSNKYTCMITPAKWQTAEADQKIASNISYGEFRKQLVPHMSHVCFYPDALDVFDIGIREGITWYIMDKQTHEKCRVVNRCKLQEWFNSDTFRSICNGETLHNIGAEIIAFLGEYKKFRFNATSGNKRYSVWAMNDITIGGRSGSDYFLLSSTGQSVYVGASKVIDKEQSFNTPNASVLAYESDDITECQSFTSWINTKFTRFFVAINLSNRSGVIGNNYFRFVPAPPSGKFDHIYTDEELYKAFNLPQKYIDVIEAVVKERK